jgi:hypothetical protein
MIGVIKDNGKARSSSNSGVHAARENPSHRNRVAIHKRKDVLPAWIFSGYYEMVKMEDNEKSRE